MTEPNTWGRKLQDAILDNAALRDGLTDTEAQPLVDWGLQRAVVVTAPLDDHPLPDERYEELYSALPKLMTRISWLAIYREKKGEAWSVKTINQINELNTTLYGADAPTINPISAGQLATMSDGFNKSELILDLIYKLTPNDENEEHES